MRMGAQVVNSTTTSVPPMPSLLTADSCAPGVTFTTCVQLKGSNAPGCSNRRPTENRHDRCERRAGRTPGHFLERTAAMLRMRGYGHFSDADVTDVAKLALTGLAHQPAA
jgi:hypothetical protein